ncbi:hypothetical protein LBMAG33_2730 [Candidatus Levyibacteriota bacterium]|nr:hypothetical protein LBMAG33_2730 [Candidatus Levybacteria bacterium]
MNISKKSKIIIFIILLLCLLFFSINNFYFIKNNSSNNLNNDDLKKNNKLQEIKVDLDGNGDQEIIRVASVKKDNIIDKEKDLSFVTLIALDKNEKELGRLPKYMLLPEPILNSGKVYLLSSKIKIKIVSFDFSAGPNYSETMFFALSIQDKLKNIIPICFVDKVKGPENCLFWSGEKEDFIVKDLDNDGNLDIVEIINEFPGSSEITEEEEKVINGRFANIDKDRLNGIKRILMREKIGKGNKIVWKIYTFNDKFFEEQIDDNYNKYYGLVIEYFKKKNSKYPKIMKKNEMSDDSLEYNLFMRKFWTGHE